MTTPGALRRIAALIGVVVFGSLWLAGNAAAQDDGTPPTLPADTTRLIPIPAGCDAPDPAAVAFVGTVVGKDDVVQVVRFQIDQLRAGSASEWAIDGLIDVRYGIDYRFLDDGQQYLVGAGFDREVGALVSTVRPPAPTFGGNDVIGLDDTAVECPVIDDPVRTVNLDGSDVDSGVLSLLFEDRQVLIATLAVPTVIAMVAMVAIVILRALAAVSMRGVFELGRAAVTPVPDHKAVRVRGHVDRRAARAAAKAADAAAGDEAVADDGDESSDDGDESSDGDDGSGEQRRLVGNDAP
ncbi:MAG: hypothetical protein AAFY28_22060 [Actinomycetota bacterium]